VCVCESQTQLHAAACLHSAARSSGQAGAPSLRASAGVPSRTCGPLCTTPHSTETKGEGGREREREGEREGETYTETQWRGGRDGVREKEISSPSGARWRGGGRETVAKREWERER